jgi:hypothetical protein
LLVIFVSILASVGCVKKEFEKPEFKIPTADTTGGIMMTIAELKANYFNAVEDKSVNLISDSIFVRGVVTANDVSGNLYKQIFVQDETGGINIQIDKTSLFANYPVGQVVYLSCKGFYVGNYGGIAQFGYVSNGAPGRIPTSFVDRCILLEGLPDLNNVPEPKTVEGCVGFVTSSDVNKLVKITNVSFVIDPLEPIYAVRNENYPERTVKDAAGNLMILSTSWYANFAADSLPTGNCEITGILSLYAGTNRLLIRDINDVKVYKTILNEKFDANQSNWTTNNVAGAEVWTYNTTEKAMKISAKVSLEDSGIANEDWLISPVIDLTSVITPKLDFTSRTKFVDVFNAEPISLWITDDYTKPFSEWTKITANFDANSSDAEWLSSGEIDLSSYISSYTDLSKVRIAFKFVSAGNAEDTASNWEIDNFSINDK